MGSDFRISGSGFRVPGFGFRVPDSGFRVPDAGFRVPSFVFRVSGLNLAAPFFPHKIRGVPGVGFMMRVWGLGFRIEFLGSEIFGLEFGASSLMLGFRVWDLEFRI